MIGAKSGEGGDGDMSRVSRRRSRGLSIGRRGGAGRQVTDLLCRGSSRQDISRGLMMKGGEEGRAGLGTMKKSKMPLVRLGTQ